MLRNAPTPGGFGGITAKLVSPVHVPNSIKELVLQSVDIVDVVGQYVPLRRQGKEFIGLCPFHPDHKPSMNVSPTKQIFKCFACGAGGDAIRFVQLHEKLEFRDALTLLAERAGVSLHTTPEDRQAGQMRDQMRQALLWARTHFRRNLVDGPIGANALAYARKRGLTRETIERLGLGYAADGWDDLLRAATRAGLSREVLSNAGLTATNESGRVYDRFRNRLMFPICDTLGRPIAFGGRTLGDDPAKYLNSPETSLFSKSRVLYGLNLSRKAIQARHEAVVVEGYMDAAMLMQHGFPHVVATLGTALTDAHVRLLKGVADRVVLCFDGDTAGIKAADRGVEISLVGGLAVAVTVLDAGMDPADCVLMSGPAGFQRALDSAVDALQFKWQQTVRIFGDGGPGARRAAVETLIGFMAELAASGRIGPLEQGLLVRRLGDLLSLPPQVIHDMLAAARRHPASSHAADAAVVDAASEYQARIRGLPAGLVNAVETSLGCLLVDSRCLGLVNDAWLAAVQMCSAWSQLYALVQNLFEEQGAYTQGDILGRSESALLCELISRSAARRGAGPAATDGFLASRERVAEEMAVEEMASLRRNLRAAPAAESGDAAFNRLLGVAREREFVLPAERRWSAKSAS